MTEHFGLVGEGIAHSLSPALWREVFALIGRDASYVGIDVGPDELPRIEADLREGRLTSVHVTMPYKKWAFAIVDDYAESAVQTTQVVNTIVQIDEGLIGSNTDVQSARILLGELPKSPRSALVIGAGATAASLVCALSENAETVMITARSDDRSAALSQRPWPHAVGVVPWGDRQAAASGFDVIVNTAPFGLTVDESPFETWPAGAGALYDLIYQPAPTILQRQALEGGAVVVDGLAHLQGHAEATLATWGIHALDSAALTRIMTGIAGRPPARWLAAYV